VAGIKFLLVIYIKFQSSKGSPLLSVDLIQGSTCSLISVRIKYTFLRLNQYQAASFNT